MSPNYDWRPRFVEPELEVLDAALGLYLDNYAGPWGKDAKLAETLLERVRHARLQAERDPKKRLRILEGQHGE